MHHVLDDSRDPVCGKCNEDNKINDLGLATTARPANITSWVSWIIFGINRNQRDGKPSSKRSSNQTANFRSNEDVAVVF